MATPRQFSDRSNERFLSHIYFLYFDLVLSLKIINILIKILIKKISDDVKKEKRLLKLSSWKDEKDFIFIRASGGARSRETQLRNTESELRFLYTLSGVIKSPRFLYTLSGVISHRPALLINFFVFHLVPLDTKPLPYVYILYLIYTTLLLKSWFQPVCTSSSDPARPYCTIHHRDSYEVTESAPASMVFKGPLLWKAPNGQAMA